MNKERAELMQFYEDRDRKKAAERAKIELNREYSRGFREGRAFEKGGRLEPYAQGWVHAALGMFVLLALVVILKNW